MCTTQLFLNPPKIGILCPRTSDLWFSMRVAGFVGSGVTALHWAADGTAMSSNPALVDPPPNPAPV